MSKRAITIADELVELAKQKSQLQFRHAACVFMGKRVFGMGYNRYNCKVFSFIRTPPFSVHAEVSAVLNCSNPRGKNVQVIRINSKNQLCNSRPCKNCIRHLKSKGIHKVYYSNEHGVILSELVELM
ncbi:hypothetical protein EB118_12500 [bacterium]|nr:hypothetical protein [bacterium]NDD83733.1 hypothetical protein [bacterium]NDG30879.1 hypothetical protein [bacterium]